MSLVSSEWTVPRPVPVMTRTATQCQGPATYVRNPSYLSLRKANVTSQALCFLICYGDTAELLKCWDILEGSNISHFFHYVKGRGKIAAQLTPRSTQDSTFWLTTDLWARRLLKVERDVFTYSKCSMTSRHDHYTQYALYYSHPDFSRLNSFRQWCTKIIRKGEVPNRTKKNNKNTIKVFHKIIFLTINVILLSFKTSLK